MKLNIEWTDDCQGKKDYDGDILKVSTRYWPAGGGYHIFDSREPEKGLRESNDGSAPSATCSIMLCDGETNGEYVDLIERDFSGPTFEAVKAQVEAWAQEQFDKAAMALRAAFPTDPVRP